MGSVVASMMDRSNEKSLIEHPQIKKAKKYGKQSVPVPGTETATSSAIYRNGPQHSDEQLNQARESLLKGPNLVQRFEANCAKRKGAVAFSYRPVNKVVKEPVKLANGTSKDMEITYLGDRRDVSFETLWGNILSFAKGLAELGLPAGSNVSIYEETRWEWLATIYGIWMQGQVASTVYANLGIGALFYALKETESAAIVCNGKSVPTLLRGIADGAFHPCVIIYLDELPAGVAAPEGVKLHKWSDVIELGRGPGINQKVSPPTDNDALALIMYTSGTTGDPKGVMHTHGSLVSGVIIMDDWLFSNVEEIPDETYVSYLPLAHILEFGVVNIMLARGYLVCFGSPRTLTSVTARPEGDVPFYRPTAFIGVPRVFDTIKKGVESKLPAPGTFKRTIFDRAYESRWNALEQGKDTPYWNEKVFSKIRDALGGRLRITLSGGGPIAKSTQKFVNVVLCLSVIGWGLTETVCIGAIAQQGDMKLGHTGHVLVGEELKLVDTEEYKHTDKPEPRGEVCLRGPFLFKGYYKQPELTKEAIDADGWFHTGDVGAMDKQGRLSLVGRIKALAKNALGEYVAMEQLESIYAQHETVLNNCVCVIVHPNTNYIAAVAVSDAARVCNFAKEAGFVVPDQKDTAALEKLCRDPKFQVAVGTAFSAIAKEAKRKPFELVRSVLLVLDEWTPENGLLTAAMKVRRRVIEEHFAKDIEAMFVER